MKYRKLGKTGLEVSEVGFGCIPIIRLGTDEAVDVLRYAFDKGITFYDTANAYHDSEYKIGKAFQGMREKVIIATKTMRRDTAGVVEQLENSLRMLQTEYIDLYQFHQVAHEKDWEMIRNGGALDAVMRAQEQGKIRHLGITSHSLKMAIELIKTNLFETIQFPFNFIESAAKDDLHQVAKAMDIGVLVMKPFAGGVINHAPLAFAFLRQYPETVPIPGYDSKKSVDEIVALYDRPNVVTEADLALMEEYRTELGQQFCRRCEYCQPCPSGVMITPAMGYKIVANRMSPAVAVDFLRKAMETVPQCTECGLCITRCPYELSIPAMLKRNYDLYENQRVLSGK